MDVIQTTLSLYQNQLEKKLSNNQINAVFVPFVNEPVFVKSIKEEHHPLASHDAFVIDGYTLSGTTHTIVVHQSYSDESLTSQYPQLQDIDNQKTLTLIQNLLFKANISQKDAQTVLSLINDLED